METVLVYGTLRPGNSDVQYLSGSLYNLGWYPGYRTEGDSLVAVEPVYVTAETLRSLDRYEGCDLSSPETSLYVRVKAKTIEGTEGWIYVYNRPLEDGLIPSGDWLEHTSSSFGRNSHLLESV